MDRVFIVGRDPVPARLRVGAGESVRWTFLLLPAVCGGVQEAGLDVEVSLCGEGASADIAGLFLCPDSEKHSIRINLRHECGGCVSEQLFKGIAGGSSRANFDGLILVAPGASGTRARQSCHSILLDSTAVVETRPQLEIYNDDVECSHGATTGFLNPDELFYMRSRGIPEAEARRLQMVSFISPVLRRLPEKLAARVLESMNAFDR